MQLEHPYHQPTFSQDDEEADARKTIPVCLDDSTDDETEDLELNPLQPKDPEPGDYVVVEYARKRSKVHYIGIIVQCKDDEGDYEIKFLKKSTKHTKSLAFVEPE